MGYYYQYTIYWTGQSLNIVYLVLFAAKHLRESDSIK